MMLSAKKIGFLTIWCIIGLAVVGSFAFGQPQKKPRAGKAKVVQLPAPTLTGTVSLEESISKRRSVRQFEDKPLTFVQMGQLCWAGQGITDKDRDLRAAPSAWGVYPIELYFVTPEGVFVYQPKEHSMEQVSAGDLRKPLAKSLGQDSIAQAGCDIIIAGNIRKLTPKAGSKALKFMLLEAGHIAENIQLQAVALGLASVPVGEFDNKDVERVCQFQGGLDPLLIVCVGFPAAEQKSKDGSQSAGKTIGSSKRALLVVPGVNYRDEELFEIQRILASGSVETVIASSKIGPLQGMLGGVVASEIMLDKVSLDNFDAVVFIGGTGAVEYFTNQDALGIARQAATARKVVAAISVAPTILANAGLLRGVRSTGYLSEREQMLKGGANYTGSAVERDGLIITSSDFSAAVPFAQTILVAMAENQQK